MKNIIKKSLFVLALSSSLFAQVPKNIIIMIGDGMGPAYTTAYRNYIGRKTAFDDLYVGMSITKSSDNVITDSAAGATAYSTGEKSYNGAIAVDTKKRPLKTIFEHAKDKGMITGIVATTEVYHATPASFYAHVKSRHDHEDIVSDLIYNKKYKGPIVDLIVGGGRKVITIDKVKKLKGYHYVDKLNNFEKTDKFPIVALFDEGQMDFEINSDDKRLTRMTKKSLELLKNNAKGGFVLMIEGSHIDKCGHMNDLACVMNEMADFEGSIKLVEDFVKKSKDTLVLITADHSTGGLSTGLDMKKEWNPGYIRNIDQTLRKTANEVLHKKLSIKLFKKYGIIFDQEDIKKLESVQNKGEMKFYMTFARMVAAKSFTGWATWQHNGVDVEVFAAGPAKELFNGKKENNEIGKILINLVNNR